MLPDVGGVDSLDDVAAAEKDLHFAWCWECFDGAVGA